MSEKPEKRELRRKSAFEELGFKATVAGLIDEVQQMYLSDGIPWVVGYSGGKDSTATLQLIWHALAALPRDQLTKPINVISTDTLVENPVVAAWVTRSLETMAHAAGAQGLPLKANRLTPSVQDSFWVNLIGRGYPAPRNKFRWCTERMKIKPSNTFISNVVRANGEAILVLGTRKAESTTRAAVMNRLEKLRVRERLSPNAKLPNCFVYSPIETWSNDDVWTFLMQLKNPWGFNNKDLLTIYQGASADGECPLVVDLSTPSCGDSRFGCWVCTVVDKDKSMAAMIQNDEEKEWMLPLLELRDALDVADDRHLRDFRRMQGNLTLHNDRLVHGPYKQSVREDWLRRVLAAQTWIRTNGPPHVRSIDLITLPELHEIRRQWVVEKHEIEDRLPRVYQETTGEKFDAEKIDDNLVFGAEEMALLRETCGEDELHYSLVRELIDIERQMRTKSRRAGLFTAIEDSLRKSFYDDEDDALSLAKRRKTAQEDAQRSIVDDLLDEIDAAPSKSSRKRSLRIVRDDDEIPEAAS